MEAPSLVHLRTVGCQEFNYRVSPLPALLPRPLAFIHAAGRPLQHSTSATDQPDPLLVTSLQDGQTASLTPSIFRLPGLWRSSRCYQTSIPPRCMQITSESGWHCNSVFCAVSWPVVFPDVHLLHSGALRPCSSLAGALSFHPSPRMSA